MIRNCEHQILMFLLVAIACTMNALGQDTASPADPLKNSSVSSTTSTPAAASTHSNYIEAGGNYLLLTDGFGSWSGGYSRGVLTLGEDVISAEASGQREFGDSGTYFALGDTHNFTSDSYASLTIGSSAGGFFWPRLRADGFFNQKMTARKQLVATVGLGYYAAKDQHRDYSLFLGSTYYFIRPWIVEDGIRFNMSNPGTVFSPSGFVAITQGQNKKHYVTLRAGCGEEAYQLIGPTTELSDFVSQSVNLTWRQWFGTNWGMNWIVDYYGSPYYKRAGATVGMFKEF